MRSRQTLKFKLKYTITNLLRLTAVTGGSGCEVDCELVDGTGDFGDFATLLLGLVDCELVDGTGDCGDLVTEVFLVGSN